MLTGSAPISKDVLNFLKIAFCCPILEGYGQTESGGPASMTWINDHQTGHVGGPYAPCEFKLVDIPDMGYTSKDVDEDTGVSMPRGEICYRGHNVFKGFFAMPEETKKTIDSEGFVHTGDIGVLLPNGAFRIVDRIKNIFKLSQGEYIIPDKIENALCSNRNIMQAFVYGDSLQNYVVAIIVPEKSEIEEWAKQKEGLTYESYEDLLKQKETEQFMMDEIKRTSKEEGFYGFEIPQKIHMTATQFTVENELLTPSFKLKRNEAKLYFFSQIKDMYNGAKLQGEDR